MKNSTRGAVDPFIVMDVMEAARQAEAAGRHIIHMEVGQPATPAPLGARNALRDSLNATAMGYTVALGLPELRGKISELYGEWYDVDLDPNRVIVTSGSSAGFLLSFTSLFDTGDRVGIGAPGYPSYRQILKALDLTAVDIPTSSANKFQPHPSDFEDLSLNGLLVASPSNPTGTMLTRRELGALIEATERSEAAFISDEIYHGIEYETKAVSALEITNNCYVINSFSKYFSMTGWRVGWMVVPENHIRQVERLAQNMFICAPHASQVVALAAMECREELTAYQAVYQKNRRLMIEGVPKAGFDRIAPPDGAFYIYADISALSVDSINFAKKLLDETGVATTPGVDFDPINGHRYLRLSFAGATQTMNEAVKRINEFVLTYKRNAA